MTRRIILGLAFICILIISRTSSVLAHGERIFVTFKNDQISPQEVEIDINSQVVFDNQDNKSHYPTSEEFDPGKAIIAGDSWTFIPTKIGEFSYTDKLNPDIKGKIIITEEHGEAEPTDKPAPTPQITPNQTSTSKFVSWISNLISKIKNLFVKSPPAQALHADFKSLSVKHQLEFLKEKSDSEDPKIAWDFLLVAYKSSDNSQITNPHDLAHYVGGLIYEKHNLAGITYCSPDFAFGCYHGFTDHALRESLVDLPNLQKECSKMGESPQTYGSCIHGIGHGVATFFRTEELNKALIACDQITNGPHYCYDGVFMEFIAANAQDKIPACESVADKYKIACARNLPILYKSRDNLGEAQIADKCSQTKDQIIASTCADAVGMNSAQIHPNDPKFIANICNRLTPNQVSRCFYSAATEVLFQKFPNAQVLAQNICSQAQLKDQQNCLSTIEYMQNH